jgi:hypothetical protein
VAWRGCRCAPYSATHGRPLMSGNGFTLDLVVDEEGRVILDGVFICRLEAPRTLFFHDKDRRRSSVRGTDQIQCDLVELLVALHEVGDSHD